MTADYNEFIQRVLTGQVYDTVFKQSIDKMRALFPTEGTVGGDRITAEFEVARTSPAAAYTKADVNPASATNTLIKPYWTKVQYHTAAEVSNIDINNAKNGGTDLSLLSREVEKETAALKDVIFDAIFTQLTADVDASTAYGTGALSRSTYPTLASYEETTDTAITLTYMRGMINGTTLLKSCGPLSGYVCLMEQAVYNKFRPLAAAVNSWTGTVKAGRPEDTGYPEVGNFEGLDIVDPREMAGMTTGDVYMLRKQDVLFTEHRPLEMEQVPSDADSVKVVIRYGLNVHVVNPGFQGKMLNKD